MQYGWRANVVLLALLLSALAVLPANAATVLLTRTTEGAEAWPAVSILPDPGGRLDAAGAVARSKEFEAARTDYLLRRLEHYLRTDDAQAEDALAQLESLLALANQTARLAVPLAALEPLAVLTAQVAPGTESSARSAAGQAAILPTWQ